MQTCGFVANIRFRVRSESQCDSGKMLSSNEVSVNVDPLLITVVKRIGTRFAGSVVLPNLWISSYLTSLLSIPCWRTAWRIVVNKNFAVVVPCRSAICDDEASWRAWEYARFSTSAQIRVRLESRDDGEWPDDVCRLQVGVAHVAIILGQRSTIKES